MFRARLFFLSFLCAAFLLVEEGSFVPQAHAAQYATSVEKRKKAALAKARARLKAKSSSSKKVVTSKQRETKKPRVSQRSHRSATQEKNTLVQQQKSVRTQLTSIQKQIEQKQSRAQSAEEALKKSEKAISNSNRSLKELAEKKNETTARLADLKNEAVIVGLQVNDAEEIVSSIGQAQFLNSMRHPWQTALVGGNPNELSRRSAILTYLAQEQDRTINRLEYRQKNIQSVAKKTEAARTELLRIEADEQRNRSNLEKDKALRSAALDRLNREIKTQKERYDRLAKNEKELSGLISKIDRQIALAQKKQAERLAAEKKRAALKKSRRAVASKATKPDNFGRIAAVPTLGNFGALKGRLTMPVKGTVVASFGQSRQGAASSLPWRGLLIRAKTGAAVRATAPGTVVFSDWMRGFGNLMILDHGSNYLSVYANNESLFKSVGDSVRQGETIAGVGNSGGEEHPGLYFELRYKGKPFDPDKWLAH
ncbi:MAG TPA: peptidase M23 [Sutterella sp.]|nr:peptidase M23 [Sutterella sp.]